MLDLSFLNANQKSAVLADEGPILVIAGAGTGKTSVLTTRIIYLIEKMSIAPNRILAFTFTNKAAQEMNNRILKMVDGTFLKWIGTYHSTCLKILKEEYKAANLQSNFNIIDEADKIIIIKNIVKEGGIDPKKVVPKKYVQVISSIKNNDLNINTMDQISFMKKFALADLHSIGYIKYVYKKYVQWLKQINALDFDDLINFTYKVLDEKLEIREKWQNKFDYVLVDEFQDTNYRQFELIKFLVKSPKNNVFAVGDPNQTIYTWRGAYNEVFNDYMSAYKKVKIYKLNQNYRSTEKIILAANSLITNNPNSFENSLVANNKNTQDVKLFVGSSIEEEANFVVREIRKLIEEKENDYKDIVILYRANYVSRTIEESLIHESIPYIIYGGIQFYQRMEIKDIISYLKAIFLNDDASILRIINTPKRRISEQTIEAIVAWSFKNNISFHEALNQLDKINELSTSAKSSLLLYNDLISNLKQTLTKTALFDYVDEIIKATNYLEYLKSIDLSYESRIENIEEFKNSIISYCTKNVEPNILDYLNEISLYTVSDSVETKMNQIKLMTIHMAKGLEFETVFVYNFSEGIFPGDKIVTELEMQEERRVAYVAITRAINRLYLTTNESNSIYSFRKTAPSRFISEINKRNYKLIEREIITLSDKDLDWFNSKTKKTIDLDKIFSKEKPNYVVGEVLVHTTFGKGVIININGEFIDIVFQAPFGKKTLISSHNSIKRAIK